MSKRNRIRRPKIASKEQQERDVENRLANRETIRFNWLNRPMFKEIKLPFTDVKINLPKINDFFRVNLSLQALIGQRFQTPQIQLRSTANTFRFGSLTTMPIIKQIRLKTIDTNIFNFNNNRKINTHFTELIEQNHSNLQQTMEGLQQQIRDTAQAIATERLNNRRNRTNN